MSYTGVPTGDNTGAYTGVKNEIRGDVYVRKDGSVLQDLEVTGFVSVEAKDVKIHNVIFHENTGRWARIKRWFRKTFRGA